MSQENVELVRAVFEAFNRHDFDAALALGRVKARGRGSGMELDSSMGWVFTVRRGKVVKAEGFLTRANAFRAASLSEQDAHADS